MPPSLFARVLVPAAFDAGEGPVEFPASRAEGDDAYDVVEHSAYLRDGADLEPTGRKARRGTLEVPLLNDLGLGELFPARYTDLLRAIDTARIGTLSHPTKGVFQAAVTLVHERLDADVQNGVHLTLTWVEHVASAALLVADLGSNGDAPATTEARAAAADDAMAEADPDATYTPTAPVVAAQLATLESGAAGYAGTTAALRTMADVVEANLALAAFASVAAYPAAAALAALRASVRSLRSRYLPQESRIRTYVTPATMADWQVAREVYRDARFAPLVRQANSVPNWLAIPPGTRLVILPND